MCWRSALAVCLGLGMCSVSSGNLAPVVSGVTACQRTDGSTNLDISYTLTDADDDRCTVTVQVSSDGGDTWNVPATTFVDGSAVGANISPGVHQIMWEAGVDLPEAFGTKYRVRVTASDFRTPEGMVQISGGTFEMGDHFDEGSYLEQPVHSVTLSSFCVGRFEVTNAEYCTYLNAAYPSQLKLVNGISVYARSDADNEYLYSQGAYDPGDDDEEDDDQDNDDEYQPWLTFSQGTFSVPPKGGRDMGNDPVGFVSWYGAAAYCNWRSEQEGLEPCYDLSTWQCDFSRSGYHLPTEAQWEYAARGGLSGKRFPWGDMIGHSRANYYGNLTCPYDTSSSNGYHPAWNDGVFPYTSPVGSFAANGYGLYDVAGNVYEWCNDRDGDYNSSPQSNPTGPSTGSCRVVRGGCWEGYRSCTSYGLPSDCRAAYRGAYAPEYLWDFIGLRLATSRVVEGATGTGISEPFRIDTRSSMALLGPDLNNNLKTDFADLRLFGEGWLLEDCDAGNAWCDLRDFNQDGRVDAGDLALTAGQWLTENSVPDDMVFIPTGTFQMGDNLGDGWSSERPVHTVTLSSFTMNRYETTNAQYCEFLNSALSQGLITISSGTIYKAGSGTSYSYCKTSNVQTYSQINYSFDVFKVRTKGGRDMSNDPVVGVSWYGAAAYCNWLSEQEGFEACYDLSTWECDLSKNGYRLPTEAEWEYAARGGLSGKRFPWGDTITHAQANYVSVDSHSYDTSPTRSYHPAWNDDRWPYTSPVGSFPPNGYGLYDMAGNVVEWCNDWYRSYGSGPQTNPTGPASAYQRICRGGCWAVDSYFSRITCRWEHYPDTHYYDNGFRVCR